MPDKGTTGIIFIIQQAQEKHKANNNKKLYYAFVELEKAFDKSP